MPDLLSAVNFHHLQVFRVVARRLSYSRAAEELAISQPAVSRHVHALESEVGSQLLARVGNRVVLTEAGRVVLAYAERMVDLTSETARALAELENLERGYLRLGASSAPGLYLLPELVAAFRVRHPGLELSLELDNSQRIEEGVLRGELDVGFVGARFLSGLQVRPFVRDELVLVVAPGHPLAGRDSISATELANVDLAVREQGSGTRQTLEDEVARKGVRLRYLIQLKGCEAIKRAAMAGLGAAVVSARSVTLELRFGTLKRVGLPDLTLERDLFIVTRKDARASAALLAFLSLVRKTPRSAALPAI